MSRSYFSRIVSPPPAAALQPPRPITSLWKAARLDRVAGISVGPHDAGPSLADPGEIRGGRPARLAEHQSGGDAVGVPRLEPIPAPNRTVEIERKNITLMRPNPPTANAVEQETRQEPPGRSSGATEEVSSVPARRDRQEGMTANAAGRRELIPPAAAPAPVSLRNDPAIDLGRRTGAEKNNSLHIGKIEVEIVAPPRSSSRPAPPLKPAGRLARGYTLWTNWQQQ